VGLPAAGVPRRGLGLLTMRERAEKLGGSFQIILLNNPVMSLSCSSRLSAEQTADSDR